MRRKFVAVVGIVFSLIVFFSLASAATSISDLGVYADDLYIQGNGSFYDLVVRSGQSFTIAGATFENEGIYTSVNTDFGVHVDSEPTSYLSVMAHNGSALTHANIVMEAGVEGSESILNILKNGPLHPYSPNASGLINDGNHGTFIPVGDQVSWWTFLNFDKDEYGNIEWLNLSKNMMTLNETRLWVNGSIDIEENMTANYFIGDGNGLTNIGADSLNPDSINTTHILDETITDEDISNSINLTLGQRITFAFNEVIDNLVDGWIRIIGGLRVTGDLEVGGKATFNSSVELLNIIYVKSLADFPPPIGATIHLEADKRYVGAGLDDANMIIVPYNIKFDERTRIENMYITMLGSITSTEEEGITFINSQIVYGGSGDLFYHNNTGGISRLEKVNIVMPPYGGTIFNWTGITDPQTITLIDQVAITSVVANNYYIGTMDGVSVAIKDTTVISPNDGFHLNNMLGTDISLLRFVGANVGGTFLTFGGATQSIIQIRSFNPIIQSTEYAIKLDNSTSFGTLTYFGSIPIGYTNRVFAPGSYDQTYVGFSFLGNTWIPDSTVKIKIYTDSLYETTIDSQDIWYELNGVWTGDISERFNHTSDGNITYIGNEDVSVFINARFSARAGNNNEIGIKFYKNGIPLNTSEGRNRLSITDTISIVSSDLVDLSYGDMLKPYIVNYDATTDFKLDNSNIIIKI